MLIYLNKITFRPQPFQVCKYIRDIKKNEYMRLNTYGSFCGKCVHKNKYIGRVYCTCVLRHVRVELHFYFSLPHTPSPRAREKEGPAHIEDNSIFSAALKGQWREMLVAYSIQSRIEIKDPKFFVRWFKQKTISRFYPFKVTS